MQWELVLDGGVKMANEKKANIWEALSILGATMKDVSSGLRGQQGTAIANYLQAQEKLKQQQAFMNWMQQQGGGAGFMPQTMVNPMTGQGQVMVSTTPGVSPVMPSTQQPTSEPSFNISNLSPAQYGVTGQTMSPTGMNITWGQTPESKAIMEAQKGALSATWKNKMTMEENLGKTFGLMQNTVAVWKAAANEKKQRGVPPGLLSMGYGAGVRGLHLGGRPHTTAYPGQRIETAMSLSRIISGGARIIRSVIQMLLQTLPEDDARWENPKKQICSCQNSQYRCE